ncbi:hypothetical protein Tco_0221478 [Tanacetum coccineum]
MEGEGIYILTMGHPWAFSVMELTWYEHVAMNLTRLGLAAATIANTCRFRIQKNLLDRVSQLHQPFLLPDHLKADNADNA